MFRKLAKRTNKNKEFIKINYKKILHLINNQDALLF